MLRAIDENPTPEFSGPPAGALWRTRPIVLSRHFDWRRAQINGGGWVTNIKFTPESWAVVCANRARFGAISSVVNDALTGWIELDDTARAAVERIRAIDPRAVDDESAVSLAVQLMARDMSHPADEGKKK